MDKLGQLGAQGRVREAVNLGPQPDVREHAAAADPPEGARILDAVEDQLGGHWIRYGTTTRSCWLSVQDLQLNEREVFSRFSGPGTTFLTSEARTRVKKAIEAHTAYRPALVAARPGWLHDRPVFIFGDGSLIAPLEATLPEIIVAFEPHAKFATKGTVVGWKSAVGPVVSKQPLPLFAIAFAFAGPLLRFAPPHFFNPECELVGPRECGKSTLGILAASVWAGDPGSLTGGAESWDMTLNFIDRQKVTHRDGLLVLDETNLAGDNQKQQREIIKKAVFKLGTTTGKSRYTDTTATPHVRLATMSTSNEPLGLLIDAGEAVRGAAQSRMVSIRIPDDRPLGVLAKLPKGFATSREAMEYLRSVVDRHYGRPIRRFIRQLVLEASRDEKALRADMKERLDAALKKLGGDAGPGGSARVSQLFALTLVAGSLARKWRILPKEWGSLTSSVRKVQRMVEVAGAAPSSSSALDRVRGYVKMNRKKLVDVADIDAPYQVAEFQHTAGFLRSINGSQDILIPSARFQREFPDYVDMMNELKKAGLARTEGGKKPKLTIKAPNGICSGGRVYCIRLSASGSG